MPPVVRVPVGPLPAALMAMAAVLILALPALVGPAAASGMFVTVESGIDLFYEDEGQGPPLLFVPGWLGSTEVFVHQRRYFAATHRVIVLDPRSQGRSSLSLTGNDTITHERDLARFIDALKLTDLVLIGWSTGCLVTLSYIEEAGTDRLKGHVCIDQPPRPLSARDTAWVAGPLDEIAAAYHSLTTPAGWRETVRWYAENTLVRRKLEPAELTWLIDQATRTPPFVAASLYASGMFSDRVAAAKFVDANLRALNIVSEQSAARAKPYLRRTMPNAEFQALGGHMMFWETPDRFNAILEGFIDGIDRQP